jgi:hypothetical protein
MWNSTSSLATWLVTVVRIVSTSPFDLLQLDAVLGNHRLHAVVERRLDLVDSVVQRDDGRALLFRRHDCPPWMVVQPAIPM